MSTLRPISKTHLASATALVTLALLTLGPAGPCFAEDPEHGHEHGGAQHHHSSHGFHPHHLALFVGVTEAEHHHETEREATFGIDYEYRFNEHFGLGGLVDYAGGDIDATVVAVALFIHPFAQAKILIAPGLEIHDGYEEELLRAGVGWDFHLGESFTLTPTFAIDFVDGEEIKVYGINFGWGF